MKKRPRTPSNYVPLVLSVLAFTLVLAALIAVLIVVDKETVNFELFFLTFAGVASLLLARIVYDKTSFRDRAARLEKEEETKDTSTTKNMYTELYLNSPVPYLIIDRDGSVESSNVAALRLFGLTQESIKGINIFTKLRSGEPNHLDLVIEKFRSGISTSDEMVTVKRPDKAEASALLSLYRIATLPVQHLGFLTLVDITKQKQAEDAKSQFVSLASHQLRTPIAGMKWSAELLEMDTSATLSTTQQKYLDRLLISIQRMAVLVDDFLRVSRFELGNFTPEYANVSLLQLLKDTMAEVAPRVAQKRIIVKTFFDTDIDDIVTDQNLLRMIVSNLYTNAVKYTRERGSIHVGYGRKDGDLIISIADNGMGIPVADQDRVFSKLYRASNAVRDVPDGTGLGLYIVKQAVKVLDGNVTFSSVEGVGTTFEVVLPYGVAQKNKS
ncbi:MAG: PAS domain-containing sensor histidine kinase [Patescibacteria group bacterium]